VKYICLILVVLLLVPSCVPKSLLLEQPKLVSMYFDRKIKNLESIPNPIKEDKRQLIKTKVEYGFGVIMEQSDRLIEVDYTAGLAGYKKVNLIFEEARESAISLLTERYPDFEYWLRNESQIQFDREDIFDLYWLAAAFGGSIKSSRGNPFELIHLPYVGRLLTTAIQLDPTWGNGTLYSAMMSYTTSRPDLSGEMLRDTVDFYYKKAVEYSDSLDAGPFLTYAESIHKPFQERKEFEDKLSFVLEMDVIRNSKYELSNLIAKNRAEWLLSNTDEYFLE
jgi:hypothetical protein